MTPCPGLCEVRTSPGTSHPFLSVWTLAVYRPPLFAIARRRLAVFCKHSSPSLTHKTAHPPPPVSPGV